MRAWLLALALCSALAVSLIGPDGSHIFNTLKPFGERLPPTRDIAPARKDFEIGRPLIAGPFVGTVSNRPVFTVGVPLFQGGYPVYCLRIIMGTRVVESLLAPQSLSPE